jgi:hypothetical protein
MHLHQMGFSFMIHLAHFLKAPLEGLYALSYISAHDQIHLLGMTSACLIEIRNHDHSADMNRFIYRQYPDLRTL